MKFHHLGESDRDLHIAHAHISHVFFFLYSFRSKSMTKNELVVIVHLGVYECAAHGFVAVCQTSKAKMKFRCVKCQPDVQFIA